MDVFETVRENVTAIDVVTMAGFIPNRSKMICCPFHNDKHPSMKVDKRFFCFGCGAKGDAIDFVANYYGIGLKAAAEKIASDLALAYDNNSYSEGYHRKSIPKKTEYQIWAEQKRELFGKLSRLHEKLRQLQMKYEPKTREDSDWSPLFALAIKDFTYVDYLYDYCMFEATEDDLKKEYEEIAKEIEKIEKRINDTESGIGGSDAG